MWIEIHCVGIGLFTFHKYHKSLESNVPLDAHGNPVTGEDSDVGYTGETSRSAITGDDERVRLTVQDNYGEVRLKPMPIVVTDDILNRQDRVARYYFQRTLKDKGGVGRQEEVNVIGAGEDVDKRSHVDAW